MNSLHPEESTKGQSRQDQILLLASEGMTDKEIAARLGLSPETVGTYWRRILGKYSAASRTEVVAKVVRLQAEETVSEIAEVNECLKEVTDHLLLVMSGREENDHDGLAPTILKSLPMTILGLDENGAVVTLNRPLGGISSGDPGELSVEDGGRSSFREAVAQTIQSRKESSVKVKVSGRETDARVVPVEGAAPLSVLVVLSTAV